MATPFVPTDLDTAAGTLGQGCPDGALTCGLDRRTRLQSTYLTWDEGSPHDVTMWYFQLTYWTDNWGQVSTSMASFIIPYIRALIVADGILNFGSKDPTDATFTLSFLIDTLTRTSGTRIQVTTAHRRADGNADIANFNFASEDLSRYDEIWMLGYEGSNEGSVNLEGPALTPAEMLAIANFMAAGGGVFATGDHAGLGADMCGLLPRVRSMRKWFDPKSPTPPPLGFPVNAPGLGPTRIDTTRPDYSSQYWFDNQSDDIPQPLQVPNPHPVLQGPLGTITQFPDHMHEGEVITPWRTDSVVSFEGHTFTEYPSLGGHQELPEIIAFGTVLSGHTTPLEGNDYEEFVGDPNETEYKKFGVVCVYDGRRVRAGRVITDSSFHHLIDLNLTGDPLGVGYKQSGFTSANGMPILNGMAAYYRNIAIWLARQTHFFPYINYVLVQPWWVKLTDPGGPVESNPGQIFQYGTLMRQALARFANDGMTVDFVQGALAEAGYADVMPDKPWKRNQRGARVEFSARVVDAALGGAAMELMAANARASQDQLSEAESHAAALKGMRTGLRALGRLVQKQAASMAGFGSQLLREQNL